MKMAYITILLNGKGSALKYFFLKYRINRLKFMPLDGTAKPKNIFSSSDSLIFADIIEHTMESMPNAAKGIS
jgi:hypothetical protein